jgi:hypothetical protein
MLPQIDMEFLVEAAPGHSISSEAGMICVMLPEFPLPLGFDQRSSDLLLRLAGGYPDVQPDMWWFHPPVSRTDGTKIPATESHEQYLGRVWQRWSRHLQPGQWHSGVDSLRSYVALVRKELQSAAAAPTAAAA